MPADAQPYDRSSFTNVDTILINGFCGDMNIQLDVRSSGTVRGVASGRDRLVRYTVNVHGTDTITNLETDKAVVGTYNFTSKDISAVDNGDGTLDIIYQSSGGERYTGPDGRLLASVQFSGNRFRLVLDDGGTPADPSDDTVISDELIRDQGPPPPKQDFCDMIRSATT